MILNDISPYTQLEEPLARSKVWRYMNVEKFTDLLESKKLYFTRVDKLSDRTEGTLIDHDKNEIRKRYENIEFPMSKNERQFRAQREIDQIDNKYRMYTLVNCWSNMAVESYAMWKIYLNNQSLGVAIQTTYENLKKSLLPGDKQKIIYQKVYYSDKNKRITQSSISFRKNKYYKFEKELRIALLDEYISHGGEPKYEHGIRISIDINSLIKKIYVSPFAPESFFCYIQYLVKSKNLIIPIVQSKILERN